MKKSKSFIVGACLIAILTLVALAFTVYGILAINAKTGDYSYVGNFEFVRDAELEEEYSENNTTANAVFTYEDYVLEVEYSYEDWLELDEEEKLTGYVYELEDERVVVFDHEANSDDVAQAVKQQRADENKNLFGIAIAIFLVAVGLAVITFFSKFFSTYEKIWFLTILVAASIVSVIFPEENMNGINGIWIMLLYLADTFLNILCELLLSKQSKWNFIVSIFVEVTEILICILLAYRFATLATTLFFWLPIDIISFINWHKHPDKKSEELTVVRKLSGWGAALVIAGIFVWTVVVGYLLSGLDITTDLFGGNELLENVVCYLDACASAVGIANGLFILFRYREQWIAWYTSSILEAVINILSGQFVLLVLKVGYLTNTTYGYIKWTKYIKAKKLEEKSLQS